MEKELLSKIIELFEYRAFPQIINYSGIDRHEEKKIWQHLVELQAQIYYLDDYLETNWEIKEKELKILWSGIFSALEKFGVMKPDWMKYCSHILKYQKHELDMRKQLMPNRLNLEYFYFYKSCDVKLLRRLLYEKLPIVKNLFTLSDWRYFDLATEVNDDILDLEDDLSTINGNGIYIHVVENGRDATLFKFLNFLESIDKRSRHKFSKTKSQFKLEILENTLQQVNITKSLLQSKLLTLELNDTSVLYTKLNKEKRA